MSEAEREANMEGEPGIPAPSATETTMVPFEASEAATVRNAPAGLQDLAWQARALSSAMTLPLAWQARALSSAMTLPIATELKLALARRDGHEIIPLAEGEGWCIVGCADHPEAPCNGWKMTRDTDTAGPDRYPGLAGWTIASEIMVEGWGERRGEKVLTPLVDKANWRAYQRDMLFWRAASQFMRRHCPAVGGGLYTLEELGGDGGD